LGAVPQFTLLGSMHPPNKHCVPVPQRVPQVPQLTGSVFRSLQTLLHTDWKAGHWHIPALHVAPVAHAVLQPPQCCTLDRTSTHCPLVPHGPSPVAQRHAP
jgi:hypothetical protein